MAHKYRDPYSNKLKSSRHSNLQDEKKKLYDMIAIGSDRWYPWPVCWSDYEWDWNRHIGIPTERAYPKRQYRRRASKYLKTRCHRQARRKEVYNSTYNKVTEYWWELD